MHRRPAAASPSFSAPCHPRVRDLKPFNELGLWLIGGYREMLPGWFGEPGVLCYSIVVCTLVVVALLYTKYQSLLRPPRVRKRAWAFGNERR